MTWLKFFFHWGILVVQFITAVLAILCWNKKKSIGWKIFILTWVLTFFTETVSKIISSYRMHNLWLYNIFDTIFYPGVLLLYADVFARNRRLKLLAVIACALLVLWQVVFLLSQNNTVLNTFYSTIASAIIIFFALVYLVQSSLDKETTVPLRNDFYYWFSAAFFIYFTFIAIMLGMYTAVTESKVPWLPDFTFYANHLVTLLFHICLWAGFTAALKWMK
jgi:hypothetical protein